MNRINALLGFLGITLATVLIGGWFGAPPQTFARSSNAPQVTLVLTPVADAWIEESFMNINTNHGTTTPLVVSVDEFLQERRALIRFDLAALPTNATMTSAVLRLQQVDAFPNPGSWAISAGQVTSAWSATTVTWATRPTSSCCTATTTTTAANTTYEWELLPLANIWQTDPTANFGVELRGSSGAGFLTDRAYESVEGSAPPQLIITYTLPTATPTNSPTHTTVPTATPTAPSIPTATATATATIEGGAVRFVDWRNQPIVGNIRILCYDDSDALLRDFHLTTDSQGHPTVPSLLAGCATISALHLYHTQPAGRAADRPAYWIYAASGPTNESTLVPVSPAGIVDLARPLILFNLVVSVEWDAPAAYRTALQNGLGHASTYLADLTEGMMAFGPVTIYTSGAHWDEADIQVQAANDLRPAAYVGGIVATPTEYVIRDHMDPTFKPAPVILGRGWNGNSAHSGSWDEESAFRTLGHEWLHYALFLYDEYQDQVGTEIYCTTASLRPLPGTTPEPEDPGAASAMAYQYRASELWHPAHVQEPAAICEQTDHAYVYQQSDWETVANHWYAAQGLPVDALPPLQQPATIPAAENRPYTLAAWGPIGDLFNRGVTPTTRIYLPVVLHVPEFTAAPKVIESDLLVEDSGDLTKTVVSQLYLYKEATAGLPARIYYQGTAVGDAAAPRKVGTITLNDIAPDDTLYGFVDRYGQSAAVPGQRFVFVGDGFDPATTTTVDLLAEKKSEARWRTRVDLVYGVTLAPESYGRFASLQVRLQTVRTADLFNAPPVAQLCTPEATVGCPSEWQKTMTLSNTTWIATFEPRAGAEELPLYGLVRITSGHPEFSGIVRWYRDLSGVGLGHMLAGAPLREGVAMVDQFGATDFMPGGCNRVFIMPAADYDALAVIGTPSLVSMPLDFDIFFKDDNQACRSDSENTVVPPMRLTLSYNEEAVRRAGLAETDLAIYHLDLATQSWNIQPTTVNDALNTTTAVIDRDGIYVIGQRK